VRVRVCVCYAMGHAAWNKSYDDDDDDDDCISNQLALVVENAELAYTGENWGGSIDVEVSSRTVALV